MVAQRRLDSQLKRVQVIAATDTLLAAGQELSVAAIARQAGVSRKFIYAHPDLRVHILKRAEHTAATARSGAPASDRVTVASLRADLANAKAQNQRLREQMRALQTRLSDALGREVAAELDPSQFEPPDALRRALDEAHARSFELEETLADTREELEAVREINRELLTAHNRASQ